MLSDIKKENPSIKAEAEAQRIAAAMYKENSPKAIESGLWSLVNCLENLYRPSTLVNFEPFFECRQFLVEIACLLSNPKISTQLQEDYYKENSGRIIKNMFQFFDSLINSDDAQKYLTWYNLKNFYSSATKEQLEYIEEIYKEKK